MTTWEYSVVAIATSVGIEEIAKMFNQEGQDGWELVEIIPLGHSTISRKTHADIYKRPRKDSDTADST